MLTVLSARAGGAPPPTLFFGIGPKRKCWSFKSFRIWAGEFPDFLPKQVENIKDPFARKLASRIERLPVCFSLFLLASKCAIFFNDFCIFFLFQCCMKHWESPGAKSVLFVKWVLF